MQGMMSKRHVIGLIRRLKVWKSAGSTGNSVADYEWKVVKCETCNGSGLVEKDLQGLREYLWGHCFGKKFKQLIKIYRDWKNNDKQTICDDCDGRGVWEARR